jgi:hypothetical protein
MERQDYYVYVYIDPRSYEEFYYGKGCRSRKTAHLNDSSDTAKALRIRDIRAVGLKPIIKVVAKGLSESEALLVEKTLIWKLGRTLTNKSSGHFADKFRPHHTLHRELPGFDFANDIYYVNVGECEKRTWADCKKHGFLSAGGGASWRDQICRLVPGDAVAAYQKGKGYVGLGLVVESAIQASRFKVKGRPLSTYSLSAPRMFAHPENPEKCEWVARVKWARAVDLADARFKRRSGLFTSQLVRASLSRQTKTLEFLEQSFGISLAKILSSTSSPAT